MKLFLVFLFCLISTTSHSQTIKCHRSEDSTRYEIIRDSYTKELTYSVYYRNDLKLSKLFSNSEFKYVTSEDIHLDASNSNHSLNLKMPFWDRLQGKNLPSFLCYSNHCFDVICSFDTRM